MTILKIQNNLYYAWIKNTQIATFGRTHVEALINAIKQYNNNNN